MAKFQFAGEIDLTQMTAEAREQFFTSFALEIRAACIHLEHSSDSVCRRDGHIQGGVFALNTKMTKELTQIPQQSASGGVRLNQRRIPNAQK